jgi:dTMP kinase
MMGLAMKRGKFIVLDGPDGCGKSTQAKLLADYLTAQGEKVVRLREPGGTRIGEEIRRTLLNPAHKRMSVKTELLLYMASRAQLVEEVIKPVLRQGKTIVCDRFLSSTIVYQGLAGGLGAGIAQRIGQWAIDKTQPDLTLILDIKPEHGLKRIRQTLDRMESKVISFHRRVRQGFLKLARQNPKRFKVIKASGTIPAIHNQIKGIILKYSMVVPL